jgi:hypothetical protein
MRQESGGWEKEIGKKRLNSVRKYEALVGFIGC